MFRGKMRKINFQKQQSLVPVIIQEESTGEILMFGYMNQEAYEKTLKTGFVYFWSRSKKKLWMKGEKSGNKLQVVEIIADCDNDVLLIKVKLIGNAVCHKGYRSCFYKIIY